MYCKFSIFCSLSVKLIIFLALPFGGCSFCTLLFMSLFVVVTHVHSYSFLFYFGLKHRSFPSFSDSSPRGERARTRLAMRVQERAIYRMQIPLLHFNVLWPDSEGGKSLTKLLLQSSTFFSPLAPRPPSPHSHTDPILFACLFVVRLIL